MKGRRKTALLRVAREKAPQGVKIERQSADAYLLALHAENVLRAEYGLEMFHVKQLEDNNG